MPFLNNEFSFSDFFNNFGNQYSCDYPVHNYLLNIEHFQALYIRDHILVACTIKLLSKLKILIVSYNI